MSESLKGLVSIIAIVSILALVIVSCLTNILKGFLVFFAIYGVIFLVSLFFAWLKADTLNGQKVWGAIRNLVEIIDKFV